MKLPATSLHDGAQYHLDLAARFAPVGYFAVIEDDGKQYRAVWVMQCTDENFRKAEDWIDERNARKAQKGRR